MGAFLSRITMSAIVGAIVAGGLIYLNMRQGMDTLTKEVTAAATAEAVEAGNLGRDGKRFGRYCGRYHDHKASIGGARRA